MRIGIIGAGNVGGTLGQAWAQRGHSVKFGATDPASHRLHELLARAGGNASVGTVAEAAAFGEVVALAIPWSAVEDALRSAGPLAGKIVLDCTNPNFSADPAGHEARHPHSGGEQVAMWAAGARVVKIFNTTGWENMANPLYGDQPISMFYAGDDAQAKETAAQLAREIGFDPIDAGSLANARMLEALAQLWGQIAYGQKQGRDVAFKLLRR